MAGNNTYTSAKVSSIKRAGGGGDLVLSSGNTVSSYSEIMRLTKEGNVGIGTTSPGSKLTVNGDARLANSGKLYLWNDHSINYLDYRTWVASSSTGMTIQNSAAGGNILLIPNGNVGIGTTSPSQKLHVEGNARVTGAYYDSNNSAGTSGQVLSSTVTGTDWVTISSSSLWTADTNGITYASNVGIGQASVASTSLGVTGFAHFSGEARFDSQARFTNEIRLSNGVGTAGQTLVSNGTGNAPEWDHRVRSDATEGGTGSVVIGNMVKITQTAYTALGTPDADTLYIIVG
jgi:hypothetical protein